MRTIRRAVVPLAAAGLFAVACSRAPREGTSASASPGQPPPAVAPPAATAAPTATALPPAASAELNATEGNRASGMVSFAPAEGGLRVTANVTGLTPGEHGFHLHERPDCSAPDGSSAGGHWNPNQQPHGGPDAPAHHAGDLGNLTADASGTAHVERVVKGLGFEGSQGVIGRAVIVHGQADDLASQPAGNAGPRVACGVVEPGGRGPSARRRDPGD